MWFDLTKTTKICAKCKCEKSIDDFAKRKERGNRPWPYCKPCRKKVSSDWVVNNLEHFRAISSISRKKYYKKHQEKHRAIRRDFRINHLDECRAKERAYQKSHPEVMSRGKKKYLKKNPHLPRIYQQNRRARIRKNGGEFSVDLPKVLLLEQNGQYPYCFADLSAGYDIDHYIPTTLGGPSEDWNAQLLCPTCNKKKADKHPHYFEAGLWELK